MFKLFLGLKSFDKELLGVYPVSLGLITSLPLSFGLSLQSFKTRKIKG